MIQAAGYAVGRIWISHNPVAYIVLNAVLTQFAISNRPHCKSHGIEPHSLTTFETARVLKKQRLAAAALKILHRYLLGKNQVAAILK